MQSKSTLSQADSAVSFSFPKKSTRMKEEIENISSVGWLLSCAGGLGIL